MLDDIDIRILDLLRVNARASIKEIASRVSLSSPAVSERIRRMEQNGTIEGYSVRINPLQEEGSIHALISITVSPPDRGEFAQLMEKQREVQRYFQVTGGHSHMVEVRCKDIAALEKLISRLQKMGPTNTQIILSSAEPNLI